MHAIASRGGYSTEGDQAGLLPSGGSDFPEGAEERLVVLGEAHRDPEEGGETPAGAVLDVDPAPEELPDHREGLRSRGPSSERAPGAATRRSRVR